MRIRRAGDAALLVETADPHRLDAAVRAASLPGVVDVVPGERTVLITTTGDPDRLAERVAALTPPPRTAADAPPVEIPVIYDGADLAEVADLTGRTAAEVAAQHAAAEYTVAYLGFSPGFGYLTGLPDDLRVPRRPTPRTSVPAGAVAIAGPYTAVYPSSSPGGWRLLGRTDTRLWDVDRDPPSLLSPGTRVRFVREDA
ncbi:5-oxoprolinase subunit PxpB [Actinomadura rayongensis]|uniref:5-oxoprolinase subunit PxpB n=1 Tax=Actinomadura rayongensis TaxID=1429076 RepID=A0A6I4W753_9ACTN|nr:5-oxoprolinase subunit PxpB [Actinomadura rayongensis]MXQ66579.1 5-oxoprolinase subunit PxpB [Actinomadura rayongensis]